MKNLIKNVFKAGVTMFLIGMTLGVAIPGIAELLGADILGEATFTALKETPVLKTGIFFGTFGMVSAVITPTVNYLFGERADKTITSQSLGVKSKELGYEQGVAPSNAVATPAQVVQAPAATVAAAETGTHFQDMLAAQRTAMPIGKTVA